MKSIVVVYDATAIAIRNASEKKIQGIYIYIYFCDQYIKHTNTSEWEMHEKCIFVICMHEKRQQNDE